VVFQFVIVNLAYIEFNEKRITLECITFGAYLIFIISTIQAIGYFLDKRYFFG
jgi:hypothetical protein